jgi:hypothetical protein
MHEFHSNKRFFVHFDHWAQDIVRSQQLLISTIIGHNSSPLEDPMEIVLEIVAGIILALVIALSLFEYRFRRPDYLVLFESKGRISLRKGLIYPRHFSLLVKRTTYPIQITMDAAARGNLGIRVKLVGSAAISPDHYQSLIRVGGWNENAATRSTDEVQVMLQELVKEYSESVEIQALSSGKLLEYLNQHSAGIADKFGVEIVTLAVQSLDPADPDIAEALRQQEQARLIEQTEQLKQQARLNATKIKSATDEEIARLEQSLELKKAELKQAVLEKEAQLSKQSLSDELARSRMRLAFEIEELEALKNSPELLMLTPQAARLAEASQNMKNARTVISLTPQEASTGADLLKLFQEFLQKAIDARKEAKEG